MVDTILERLIELFPKGRAFRVHRNGVRWHFLRAIAIVLADYVQFNKDILLRLIPDNDTFDESDAENWERRLALFVKNENPLSVRNDSILRKYAQPGTVLGKNSYLYIQRELQRAGFDVYIQENRFPDGGGGFETRPPVTNPYDIYFDDTTTFFDDTESYMGRLSPLFSTFQVANSIDPLGADEFYTIGPDERRKYTFFIGGETWPDNADVPANRQNEFRQLILSLKPSHTVAWLNINYI